MRVIAILCFYDESPTWLASTVASLAKCADHLVAVDGAYRLYPHGHGRSHIDQADAIVRTAEAVGIGLTLYQQAEPFDGNEVEKRSLSLRLAETIATPYEDWYLVIDADEVVLETTPAFRATLERTDKLVATYGLTEWQPDPYADDASEQYAQVRYEPPLWTVQVRGIYRALPGLRYEHAHYVVRADIAGEPVYLFGIAPQHNLAPAEELYRSIRIEHRNRQRTRQRAQAAREYYAIRDNTDAEALSRVFMESPDGALLEVK